MYQPQQKSQQKLNISIGGLGLGDHFMAQILSAEFFLFFFNKNNPGTSFAAR